MTEVILDDLKDATVGNVRGRHFRPEVRWLTKVHAQWRSYRTPIWQWTNAVHPLPPNGESKQP